MPKTLLAIDDSATMRKVLEITFGGEEFRVVSADGSAGALARLGEDPVAAVIDTSLGGDDGYALAKELRSRSGRLAVVLMASRYSPYDANRGRDAGVDDFIDKPFDTQSLIDKVKKAITARETGRGAAAQPAAPAPANVTASYGGVSPPRPQAPTVTGPTGGIPGPSAGAKPAWGTQRTHTLSFEGTPTAAPPQGSAASALSRTAPSGVPVSAPAPSSAGHAGLPGAPSPFAATQAAGGQPSGAVAPPPSGPQPAAGQAPFVSRPEPRQEAVAPPSASAAMPTTAPRGADASSAAARAGTSANGQLAGKLDDLGLTPQQAEAVLALSRELVERVVWEVVPPLAETLIREEIARLTKEA